ncbi:MAG: YbgC/FadM family acyl-CoA thioesterase [Pseudomonadota bacterium]
MTKAAHLHNVRVYYEDTDAGGVVYHANYLKFAERARTEWLRSIGLDHQTLRQRFAVVIVVAELEATFKKPAALDDELVVESGGVQMRGPRITIGQRILRLNDTVVELRIVLVAVDLRGRPVRPPRAFTQAVSAFSADQR